MPEEVDATELVTASCFGVNIAVRCKAEHKVLVRAQFPLGFTDRDPLQTENTFVLYSDPNRAGFMKLTGAKMRRSGPQTLPGALNALKKEIHLRVAEKTRSYAFIHSGVVLWRDKMFLFPGASFSGKSTLVYHLVENGATYYSDEYAVVDERGYVHPFLTPVKLRVDGSTKLISTTRNGTGAKQPAVVALTAYRDRSTWIPKALTPGESMLRLIANTLNIRTNAKFVMSALKEISLCAQSFMGTRGEADQMLEWMNK